jgi:hypothetical protein|tara:strand:- start:57 stop:737 length:681 start_codon:yes stop_codon:yes gene_type:complete
MKKALLILLSILCLNSFAQDVQLGLLKYNGGGDWYSNLETSLPNLIKFTNIQLNTNINIEQSIVDVGSEEIFKYPFIHMTGHGNVVFSNTDAENLRKYMLAGGFLHIDDNYGMDKFIRLEIKKVFPELEFVELPFSHPIYHQSFDFKNGLPKIHEHDNVYPKGYGLIYDNRLLCFYSFESDLGDGWESTSIHNDPEEKRNQALQMGANILEYVFIGDKIKSNNPIN